MKEKKKKTNKCESGCGGGWGFVAACAAGFVTGAVVALLYAPADGAATRKNIKEKVDGGMDLVRSGVRNYSDAAAFPATRAKFQVERLFAAVSAGFEEAKRTRHSFDDLI